MKSSITLALLLSSVVLASPDYVIEGTELKLQRNLSPNDPWIKIGRSVGVVIYHPKGLMEMDEGEPTPVDASLEINGSEFQVLGPDVSFQAYVKSFYGSPLCKSNEYYNENLLGSCTAFIIGEKEVMTAGHCLENFDVTDNGVLLDGDSGYPLNKNILINTRFLDTYIYFKDEDSPKQGEYLDHRRMYRMVKVLEASNSKNIDYAIVELDRKIEGREILKLAHGAGLQKKDELRMIGYPLGLPLSHSSKGWYSDLDSESPFRFDGTLSVFGGFSGSPIFNVKTKEIVGILNTGQVHKRDEFVLDREKNCVDFYVVPRHEAEEEISATVPGLTASYSTNLDVLFEDAIYGNYIALKLNNHRDWGAFSFESLMGNQDINELNQKFKLVQKSLSAYESHWPDKSKAGVILWKFKYYGIRPTQDDISFAKGLGRETFNFLKSVFSEIKDE